MSGSSRLVNSKLTSEGKAGSVVKALSGDINKQAADIKEISCKYGKKKGKK